MADNVTLSAGTADGAVIATDDIGGVHYQYVKSGIGAGDTFTILVGGAGNVAAGVQRVTIATDQAQLTNKLLVTPDLPSGASTSAKQDTEITALQLIDDIVYVDDADWTDDTSKHALVGGVYQATPHTVTDGDVTPFLTDANGRLAVAVNGTVAISNAGLTELAAAIDTELQVDIVGSLPAGTNGIGKLTSNAGVTIGAVEIAAAQTLATVTTVGTVSALGISTTGPMKAEDVAHATGDMGIPPWGVRMDSPNATFGATNDYIPLTTDMVGGIRTALYETDFAVLGTKHVKKYYTSTGAVTDGIVWSPAANTRWYVTDLIMNTSAAATITFEDDKAGGDEVVAKFELAANSGITHSFATPWFSGEDAADLLVTTSAGNIYITITGYEI